MESQYCELKKHNCENDKLPVNPSLVQNLLLQLNPSKSMRPDGVHPRVLKGLADVITSPLLMIFEWSQESEKVSIDWNLTNASIFQKGQEDTPGNHSSLRLTSVPGKIMERIMLGVIEKHLKDSVVMGHSQHRFMRGKSSLSNLISFFDKVTPQLWSFLDFSKNFDNVCHRILLYKKSSTQLDKHITQWVSNCEQRVMVNGVTLGW